MSNVETVDFQKILRVFTEHSVEFIIIGGAAATVHGSARLTKDLDLVYSRKPENITRMIEALNPYQPYPRGSPPGLPFHWDEKTIRSGLNFTLDTTLGPIDLLGEVTGGGFYENLLPDSVKVQVFGIECLCLGVRKLIHVKRAAGRPKDFEAIAELEAILDERDSQSGE